MSKLLLNCNGLVNYSFNWLNFFFLSCIYGLLPLFDWKVGSRQERIGRGRGSKDLQMGLKLWVCSAINPSKVHTHSSEHTDPEQWAAIYAAAPGEQSGHLSRGIEGGERVLYIHSPHLQFLPAQDTNSQPFDYEANSLTIRQRLPHRILSKAHVPWRYLGHFLPRIYQLNFRLVNALPKTSFWTTLKTIFSIFKFFYTLRFQIFNWPNIVKS